jgi:2-dehydropantoate 2-reductase
MTVPGNGARIILKLGKYTVPGPRANLVDLCTEKSVRSIETFASTSQLNIRMEGLNQGRGGDGFSKLQSRDHAPHESPLDDTDVRRIHVLGMGSIGLLVAHSLMRLEQSPPISLLLHRAELVDNFRLNRTARLLNKHTDEVDVQSGYSFESLESESQEGVPNWRRFLAQKSQHPEEGPVTEERPIHSLIVACKSAGDGLSHPQRQAQDHTRNHYLPDAERYGPSRRAQPESIHKSSVATRIHPRNRIAWLIRLRTIHSRPCRRRQDIDWRRSRSSAVSSNYTPTQAFNGTSAQCFDPSTGTRSHDFDYAELLQLQFEKLVVNCVLNPLTALVDVRNGGMLNNDPLSHVQCALIAEISKVIQALPEMQGNEELSTRFGSERLTERFIYVTQLTAKNSSSMREDVRGKRDTEIEYINGYIVRRGKEVGIECVANALMMQLVQGKTIAGRKEHLP